MADTEDIEEYWAAVRKPYAPPIEKEEQPTEDCHLSSEELQVGVLAIREFRAELRRTLGIPNHQIGQELSEFGHNFEVSFSEPDTRLSNLVRAFRRLGFRAEVATDGDWVDLNLPDVQFVNRSVYSNMPTGSVCSGGIHLAISSSYPSRGPSAT